MKNYILLNYKLEPIPSYIEKKIVCHKNKCNHCCYNDSFIMHIDDKAAIRAVFEKLKSRVYNPILLPEKGKVRPCAMLDLTTGKCSIYENRPQPCKSYHSTSEESCIKLKQLNIDKPDGDPDDEDKMLVNQVIKVEHKVIKRMARSGDTFIRRDVLFKLAEDYLESTDWKGEYDLFYRKLERFVNNPLYNMVKR